MEKDRSIIVPARDLGIHEECGIMGIYSKEKAPLAKDIYFGLFALQHRGQESAGIAVNYDGNKIAYYKNMGLVNDVFGKEELDLLPDTNIAVGHVRYATVGSSNVVNAQPVVFYGRYGRMAVAYNGSLVNASVIKERMIQNGHIFQSSTDCEIVAALINQYSNLSLETGIEDACRHFFGAYALVVLAENKLIAVRDANGLKPLVMGEKDGNIIFASESCAFDAIDARFIRDVAPGEMVIVKEGCCVESRTISLGAVRSCIFEYVYLARSDSVIDEVSVYNSRYECGRMMAEMFKIDADIVSGVPDSAVVAARGYSEAAGLPYVDALSKNRYIGRTFIQPSQSMRESSVKIKLTAFRHNIQGKRLILIDDSIVRGTTSKKIISLLRQSGATEVHVVIASPIVKCPCYFGVDMETKEQLIGAYRDSDEICSLIGADSLHYVPLDYLIKACGSKDFCTGCFDGHYPMDISDYHQD